MSTATDLSAAFPSPADIDFSTDSAARMLQHLFDTNWWDIKPGSESSANSAASVLFPILGDLNLMCLTAITLFFTYFIGIGFVGTAHDASPLGKKYHSWWPIARFSFSISALAPVAKGGLSIFQVLILTACGWSLNFVNLAWDTALDYLGATGGQLVAQVPDSVYNETHQIAGGMLKSITLQQFYAKKWSKTVAAKTASVEWTHDDDSPMGTYTFYFQPPNDTGISEKDMGGITFYCPNSSDNAVLATCNARVRAASQLYEDLKPIAIGVVGTTAGERELDISAYEKAIEAYNSTIATSLGSFITSQQSEFSSELDEFLKTAKSDGWLSAGSYFWTLSHLHAHAQSAVMTTSSYIEPQNIPLDINDRFEGFQGLAERLDELRAQRYSRHLQATGVGAEQGDWASMVSSVFRPLLHGAIDLVAGAKNETLGLDSDDPVARIATAGHLMIGSIEAGAVAICGGWLLAQTGADSVAGKIAGWIPGAAAAKAGLVHLSEIALVLFAICALPLLVVACTFAYYLPALPYVLWTCAIVGWLIVLIESMVAAPFWVAAHAMPEGEGIAGTSGRQGYMLLFGVLLRPVLMIVGFMCALVLIQFIGVFVSKTFMLAESSMNADSTLGLVGCGCMLTIYAGLITVLSHKIFGLITHLPDNCLNWVGQQLQNLNEAGDEARTRGVFSQVGQQGQGMAQGVGRMAAGKFSGNTIAEHGAEAALEAAEEKKNDPGEARERAVDGDKWNSGKA